MQTSQLERVTCGWCKTEFDIDPTEAANLYKCPGLDCGERQTLGAYRHADLTSDALDLSHQFSTATASYLHRVGLAFVYRKGSNEKIGSGTLVQIGDRLLIATAGHTLPNDAHKITVVPKLGTDEVERDVKVLGCYKSESHDVGVIEVEADAARLLGMEAISIESIADLGAGREAVRGWLIGYPEAQVFPDTRTRVVRIQSMSTYCEPIPIDAWHGIPREDDEPSYDPDAYVMTHYCLSDPLYVHPDNPNKDKFAPEPFGLSGGGFWQCPESREGQVWAPSMLSLFAIQSSWCKGHKHLMGVQIIHWLRLVAEVFPDLAEELRQRFPRL